VLKEESDRLAEEMDELFGSRFGCQLYAREYIQPDACIKCPVKHVFVAECIEKAKEPGRLSGGMLELFSDKSAWLSDARKICLAKYVIANEHIKKAENTVMACFALEPRYGFAYYE
jgi:hypothetical protein